MGDASLEASTIDYPGVLAGAPSSSPDEMAKVLAKQLSEMWKAAYVAITPRETQIFFVRHGLFQYMFDHPMPPASAGVAPSPACESRLVAAFGWSTPQRLARDDFRLRRWVGATEAFFGRGWDKGHFIAHSIGGAVDQCELNVFVQRRDLNRGWSAAGKRFRLMEKYCFQNPGTFCFSRPIYTGGSARPGALEFGVLTTEGEFWVELFDNR